jgi:hypothetical protein
VSNSVSELSGDNVRPREEDFGVEAILRKLRRLGLNEMDPDDGESRSVLLAEADASASELPDSPPE